MRDDLDEDWLEVVWEHSILPYVGEQFFGAEHRLTEFDLSRLRNQLGDRKADRVAEGEPEYEADSPT